MSDIWFISDTGAQLVEGRMATQQMLQQDPTAMATLMAGQQVLQAKELAVMALAQQGQPIRMDDFMDAYGDMVSFAGPSQELAIITVNGPMDNRASRWDRYFGSPSYERMRNVLDSLQMVTGVKEVLWVWRSPGGNAKGSFDLADHMSRLQSAGLRMTSYAETAMMSAAMLLGAVPTDVYAASDADVGSVGAMSTLFIQAKAMEQAGVEAKTFKFGRLKDIGSPYREMTKEEESFFQKRVNMLGEKIAGYVQLHRNLNDQSFQAAAGEAKVVFGSEAAASGLVDGVRTLQEVVNTILARHNGAHLTHAANTGATKMKYKLNAKGLAAVASGMLSAEALKNPDLREEMTADEIAAIAAEGTAAPVAAEGGAAPVAAEGGAAPVAAEGGAAPVAAEGGAAPAADLTGLVAQLTQAAGEKVKLEGALAEAQAKAAALQGQVDTMTAQLTGLAGIAAKALLNLEVACGATTVTEESLLAMAPDAMVARHAELNTAFKSKMTIGGRARADLSGIEHSQAKPAAAPARQAQMVAVGLSNK